MAQAIITHKRKTMTRFIPFAVFLIAAYSLCLVQANISMREYENSLSAACMTCSLSNEIFRYSWPVLLIFALIYIALWKIKNIYKDIILTVIYMLACMFVNNVIFVTRESAWTTYLATEELKATWHLSYPAILVSAVILFLIIAGTGVIVKARK